jgi:hypothetical protein
MMDTLSLLLTLTVGASAAPAFQPPASGALRPGAKVFIHAMPNSFDTFFKAALGKKKVPVVVVEDRAQADFEIRGTSESQKASAAKKIFLGSWHSDEQASVSVISVESGEVVFAYSVNKKNSAHGQRSTAEACAKHLKQAIERRK